jgi:hypothetical protein
MLTLNPNRNPMKSFEYYFDPAKLSDFVDLSKLRNVLMFGKGSPIKGVVPRNEDEIMIISHCPDIMEAYNLQELNFNIAPMRPDFAKWCAETIGGGDWGPSSIDIGKHTDGSFSACVNSKNCISQRLLCKLLPE